MNLPKYERYKHPIAVFMYCAGSIFIMDDQSYLKYDIIS